MSPEDEGELRRAAAAHGDPGVRHPHRGRVPKPAQGPGGARHLVQAHEGRLPASVILNSAVQGVQPVIPLLDVPEIQEKMINMLSKIKVYSTYLALKVQLLTLLVMLNSF